MIPRKRRWMTKWRGERVAQDNQSPPQLGVLPVSVHLVHTVHF